MSSGKRMVLSGKRDPIRWIRARACNLDAEDRRKRAALFRVIDHRRMMEEREIDHRVPSRGAKGYFVCKCLKKIIITEGNLSYVPDDWQLWLKDREEIVLRFQYRSHTRAKADRNDGRKRMDLHTCVRLYTYVRIRAYTYENVRECERGRNGVRGMMIITMTTGRLDICMYRYIYNVPRDFYWRRLHCSPWQRLVYSLHSCICNYYLYIYIYI